MEDFLTLPYIIYLNSVEGAPAITLARRIPGGTGAFPYEGLWAMSFPDEDARKRYFDVLWAQIHTGCWPLWGAIAAKQGSAALTSHLDEVVKAALAEAPSEGPTWERQPRKDLKFEAQMKKIRFMLIRSEDQLSITFVDRFGDTGPENLWYRRFETTEACNKVFRALWRDSTLWLPRLRRLIRSGGIREFEAYVSARVPGYEPEWGSPPAEDDG